MARFTYRGNARVIIHTAQLTLTEVGLGTGTDITAAVRSFTGGELLAPPVPVLAIGELEIGQRLGPATWQPITVGLWDELAAGDRTTIARGTHWLYLVVGPADGTAIADEYKVQTLGSFRTPVVANEAASAVARFTVLEGSLDQAVPAS